MIICEWWIVNPFVFHVFPNNFKWNEQPSLNVRVNNNIKHVLFNFYDFVLSYSVSSRCVGISLNHNRADLMFNSNHMCIIIQRFIPSFTRLLPALAFASTKPIPIFNLSITLRTHMWWGGAPLSERYWMNECLFKKYVFSSPYGFQ